MGITVAETIRNNTRRHLLEGGGLLFGQCVRAVGWVGGSIPELTEEQGIVELPTSDVSNGGVVVGAALAGRRPIYVIRYQGFAWYNMVHILNYAAKSKELWNTPCPLFVRSIAMQGSIGPVAGGSFHNLAMGMPGMAVMAPMTPLEWQDCWDWFLDHDDPVYCSEHRLSFQITDEITDSVTGEMACNTHPQHDVTIVGISAGRLGLADAARRVWASNMIIADTFHLTMLKPLDGAVIERVARSLAGSKFGLVVDSGHVTCGAAEHVACELMARTGKRVYTLGLWDHTAGFARECDNLVPAASEIADFIRTKMG